VGRGLSPKQIDGAPPLSSAPCGFRPWMALPGPFWVSCHISKGLSGEGLLVGVKEGIGKVPYATEG